MVVLWWLLENRYCLGTGLGYLPQDCLIYLSTSFLPQGKRSLLKGKFSIFTEIVHRVPRNRNIRQEKNIRSPFRIPPFSDITSMFKSTQNVQLAKYWTFLPNHRLAVHFKLFMVSPYWKISLHRKRSFTRSKVITIATTTTTPSLSQHWHWST